MATSLQQWESDPLFSAAEVVQDSADRVESIFRLLLHEESLLKGNNPETRLEHSIEYHRRDLATILETTKWQLEDFEREVNHLAVADNSQERQNVIYRHRQFIQAIREQMMNVERRMKKLTVGESSRNYEWVYLDEQDRDGLASFLSGGTHVKNARSQDSEDDASVFRKFLDPAGSSGIVKDIAEPKSGMLNLKDFAYSDPNLYLRGNELREEASEIDFEASSTQENAHRRGEEIWDLEANKTKAKTFSKQNKVRGYYNRLNPFRSLRNFLPTYGRVGSRSITQRWKDGEEQRHSQSGVDLSHPIQSYIGQLRLAQRCRNIQFLLEEALAGIMYSCGWASIGPERHQRSSNNIQGHSHPVVMIFALLLILIILGVLVSKIL